MGNIESKLNAMGYQLPPPFTFPKNNRTGCTQMGSLLLLSGHGLELPKLPDMRQTGKFGAGGSSTSKRALRGWIFVIKAGGPMQWVSLIVAGDAAGRMR